MGAINTYANLRSAGANRATARNTAQIAASSAATAAAVQQVATAHRHAELRERGLIDHRSTPAQIAAVEHTLAARMRARVLLEGSGGQRHPFAGPKWTLGIVATLMWLFERAPSSTPADRPFYVTVTLLTVLGCALWALAVRAQETRRTEALDRAALDTSGVCGWCGQPGDEHLVDNEIEHPLIAHAPAVEQHMRARL